MRAEPSTRPSTVVDKLPLFKPGLHMPGIRIRWYFRVSEERRIDISKIFAGLQNSSTVRKVPICVRPLAYLMRINPLADPWRSAVLHFATIK